MHGCLPQNYEQVSKQKYVSQHNRAGGWAWLLYMAFYSRERTQFVDVGEEMAQKNIIMRWCGQRAWSSVVVKTLRY